MKMDRQTIYEFVRFGIVGGLATLLHYGIYLLLSMNLDVNVSYAIGYIISFLANFYLTAYFTFKKAPSWKKGIGFAGAHVVNFLIHMGLLNLFLWMGIPAWCAPIPVFAVAIPVNFLLVRFVFKNKNL